jgi:ketosteroid isomerase-like protein
VSTESIDHQAILTVLEQEAAVMRDGSVDHFVALLTDDGVLMPPNETPKAGAELRQWLGDFLQRFRVAWLSLVHDETVVSGDLAYHAYTYTWRVTPKGPGEPAVASGKGLHILRRDAHGTWRIAREIWNATPAR